MWKAGRQHLSRLHVSRILCGRPLGAPVFFFLAVSAQAGWITLPPNVEPRQEIAAAAAQSKVYMIGGIRGGPVASSSATVEVFDPLTNRWSFAAPLPEPLHHSAAVTFENQIYVFGGYRTIFFDSTDAAYRFNPITNVWLPIARMPQTRAAHAAALIGERIYVVGGTAPLTAATWAYLPREDRWEILAPMPTPREHLAAAAINEKLYVAGGRVGGQLSLRDLEEYDPSSNTWRRRASLPTGRSGIAAATLNGRIYVFGGEGNGASPSGTYEQNESYDPGTDGWRTETPMPTPRHGIAAAVIGPVIYLPGGATEQGFGVTDIHEAFVVPSQRPRAVRQ